MSERKRHHTMVVGEYAGDVRLVTIVPPLFQQEINKLIARERIHAVNVKPPEPDAPTGSGPVVAVPHTEAFVFIDQNRPTPEEIGADLVRILTERIGLPHGSVEIVSEHPEPLYAEAVPHAEAG